MSATPDSSQHSQLAGSSHSASAAAEGRRRSDRLAVAIFVVALIGTLEAAYLTYVHYNGLQGLICVNSGAGPSSCEQVQSSVYSELVGIPVAVLGLISYLTILVSLRIRGELGRVLGFTVALIGFVFSLYLTYREVFTLHEICEWCVGSAVWMTLLTIFTATRYLRGAPPQS